MVHMEIWPFFKRNLENKQLGPLLLTCIDFNPGMDIYIHYKIWDEITNPFLNVYSATIEV